MTPKRARTMSQAQSFVSSKFISFVASKQYKKSLSKNIPISKRGLQQNMSSRLLRPIRNRKWHKLMEHPEPAIVSVVREFYANAFTNIKISRCS